MRKHTVDLFLTVLHEYNGGGMLAGFLHPLLGLDHLLAMLAVGMLSAQLGGRAIWTVPAVFVVCMAAGGLLGMLGVPLPAIELGISLSVILLGVAIAANRRVPIALAMFFVGLFGLFHGHAHGAELPANLTTPLLAFSYVFGFLLATAGLHVIGALLGVTAKNSQAGELVLRSTGALIALIGVFFVFSV
jgi:urease accessory protein